MVLQTVSACKASMDNFSVPEHLHIVLQSMRGDPRKETSRNRNTVLPIANFSHSSRTVTNEDNGVAGMFLRTSPDQHASHKAVTAGKNPEQYISSSLSTRLELVERSMTAAKLHISLKKIHISTVSINYIQRLVSI